MCKRLLITFFIFLISSIPPLSFNQSYAQEPSQESTTVTRVENEYEEYLMSYKNLVESEPKEVVIEYKHLLNKEQYETIHNLDGVEGISVVSPEEGTMVWEFDVPENALYRVEIQYHTSVGKGMTIERELKINGEVPYKNAQYLTFTRVWKNDGDIERDANDNDLRPGQVEEHRWITDYFRDYLGYIKEPLLFYFSKGKNTLELTSVQDSMIIRKLTLKRAEPMPTYDELKETYKVNNYQEVKLDQPIKIQGEDAIYKSDPMLYPTYDRSNVATEPSHPTKIRLNTIGGDSWKQVGQWITWEVEVPESGLYQIGIKYWQNFKSGTYVARTLKIDGKVPFQEVMDISFPYNANWQVDVLRGEEEPYLFYLEKGKHEISLEVSLGDLATIISEVETTLLQLNEAYREMLMIIGSTPDIFRDYQLEIRTPKAIEILKESKEKLEEASYAIRLGGTKSGASTTVLDTLVRQLEEMYKQPRHIPERWTSFQNNLSSLGAWVLNMQENPLQIDYLFLTSTNLDLPKANENIFKNTWFATKAFIGSFFEDYSSVGGTGNTKDAITVWVSNRDHGNILNSLVKNYFIDQSGIHVNVEIVDYGTLLPATLAGQGPDVALGAPIADPVNYAIRNALVDLTQFEDFEEIAKRFSPSAIVPYEYNGGVYALPETQTFPMMFYRKDIFEELGIEKPETWDDLYTIMPFIQKNHMNIGIPLNGVSGTGAVSGLESTLSSFTMFLYQNGGQLYTENGDRSLLDSPEAIQAFDQWTSLYINYSIPVAYDFANRFRTGEMPLGIADYSTYNYLSVFAPELKGLWEMVPVPGTRKPDGTIDRSVSSSGTATVLLGTSKKKEEAWEFMKWWTSADIQAKFGNELESIIGVAARYATANLEAVEILGWPSAVNRNLQEQWKWVKGNPEVPGAYFTPRHIENAFRRVYNDLDDPRETILDYTQVINREITNKRKEFNLPVAED